MNRIQIFALATIALVGVGCSSGTASTTATASAEPSATAVASIGAPAPAFSLTDQTGKRVSLADYSGKIVVLEWINPDCPFVQRHARLKTMDTLARKYENAGVVWLGINSTNYMNDASNAKWIAANSLPYPVLDDHTGEVGHAYGARTTPNMYVIDAKGRLVYEGAIDNDPGGEAGGSVNYVDVALTELLAGKPVSTAQTKPYGCSVKYAN